MTPSAAPRRRRSRASCGIGKLSLVGRPRMNVSWPSWSRAERSWRATTPCPRLNQKAQIPTRMATEDGSVRGDGRAALGTRPSALIGTVRGPLAASLRRSIRSLAPTARWRPRRGGRLEQLQAVGRAGQRVDGVLGMRHQADDVAALVADAGDVVERAVGVVARCVAEDDPALGLELGEHLRRGEVAAGRVLDRDREHVAHLAGARPGRAGVDDLDVDLAAEEAEPVVGQQGAGQQTGLAEDLEAVADPEHRAARLGELLDPGHRRSESGDRADPQVVAVGEAAGDDDRIDVAEVVVTVPDDLRVADPAGGENGIDLVAAAGEPQHPEPHFSSTSMR